MLVTKLECLNQSHHLINWTADWQIIDSHLTQGAFIIDYEQTSEIHTQHTHSSSINVTASIQCFSLSLLKPCRSLTHKIRGTSSIQEGKKLHSHLYNFLPSQNCHVLWVTSDNLSISYKSLVKVIQHMADYMTVSSKILWINSRLYDCWQSVKLSSQLTTVMVNCCTNCTSNRKMSVVGKIALRSFKMVRNSINWHATCHFLLLI